MSEHWLRQVKGFSHFSWVYDLMHCMDIGAASHCIANMCYDICFKELHGSIKGRILKLNELMIQEFLEAYEPKEVSAECRIHYMEARFFCDPAAPHQNFPDLMHSVIKAGQTRYLIPAFRHLAVSFRKEGCEYSQARQYCMENLALATDLVDSNPLFLEKSCYAKYKNKKHMDNFQQHYMFLAMRSANCSARIGSYQWSFVPKFHFLERIVEDAKWLSPKAMWRYSGQSMAGLMTSVASSCLSGIPPHRGSETLCAKYRVARHLSLAERAA